MTLPCRKCSKYWEDMKFCTKHELFSFSEEFQDIKRDECFEEKIEDDNLWKYNRGETV